MKERMDVSNGSWMLSIVIEGDCLGFYLKAIVVAARHAHFPEGGYQGMSPEANERANRCCASISPKVIS